MPARPKGHADSGAGEQNTNPRGERTRWNDAIPKPAIMSLRLRKQIKTQSQRKHVAKALQPGFTLLGLLSFERRGEPEHTKQKPQRIDPLA